MGLPPNIGPKQQAQTTPTNSPLPISPAPSVRPPFTMQPSALSPTRLPLPFRAVGPTVCSFSYSIFFLYTPRRKRGRAGRRGKGGQTPTPRHIAWCAFAANVWACCSRQTFGGTLQKPHLNAIRAPLNATNPFRPRRAFTPSSTNAEPGRVTVPPPLHQQESLPRKQFLPRRVHLPRRCHVAPK